jgi:hypothetical protein
MRTGTILVSAALVAVLAWAGGAGASQGDPSLATQGMKDYFGDSKNSGNSANASNKGLNDLTGKSTPGASAKGLFQDIVTGKLTPPASNNQLGSSPMDYIRDYGPLAPSDKALGVGKPQPGAPKIPSRCAKEGAGCSQCFAEAQGDIQHLRFAFEKLRAIGEWTKTFTTRSIAFGDSVSGVHGVAGLGWQPERRKIEESYAKFGEAYDAKYEELIGDMEQALKDLGTCEAKHFGTDDWYDRNGFIYYSFVADRYKR